MKITAVLAVAGLACASAFVVPAPQAARTSALAAEKKGYVPDGLTRAQWEQIQAEEAAKKANKKPRKDKVETLDEFQKKMEEGKMGHRFAKMKFDAWYKK